MRCAPGSWLLGLLVACSVCCPINASSASSDSATGSVIRTSVGSLDGAPYRIDIPKNWNGDLVVLMHGYEPKGVPRQSPWPQNEETPVFLSRGFAVAASAFASQGWAVGDALEDSEQLRRLFIKENGKPHRAYLVGFSLGGLEALATLERHGPAYSGALSVCGVNVSAPDIVARGVVTPLVAFDTYFPGVMPDLANPASPAMIDSGRIQEALQSDPTKAARLEDRLQETSATLPGTLMLNYMLLREIEQRAGGMPVDTMKANYTEFADDADFKHKVRRYKGTPSAMTYLADNVTLTGRVASPVVLQRNAFDQTVPSRFDTVYPELAKAAGNASKVTVLPRVGEGHCDFTHEQIGKAFDVLVEKADRTQGR
ncbi:alpha/beta hydrolase [Dyella halodurans]|uniref:Alpha/beta hydrolase n=1 Tax=Dyella halodurans TaxID=1920171 RepID=A0ABV9C033_9GAMM|nr:alpha/beta hydrolase [Dyella halodurans]